MLVENFKLYGLCESAIKLAGHCVMERLKNIHLMLVSREVEESLKKRENC